MEMEGWVDSGADGTCWWMRVWVEGRGKQGDSRLRPENPSWF